MPRLTVNLSDSQHLALMELARRSQASLSQLSNLAIAQLLLKSRDALPLLPPLDLAKAATTEESLTCVVPGGPWS